MTVVYLSFLSLKPFNTKTNTVTQGDFQVANALKHLNFISQKPHYSGSQEHERVRKYIATQLRNLGLSVEIQQTRVTTKKHTFKSKTLLQK